MSDEKPRIVTLCGSVRFPERWIEATKQETLAGHIVLSVGVWDSYKKCHDGSPEGAAMKARLDELHKRKIDLSDEVVVVTEHIGESTKSEIEYAEKHGKPVRYLSVSIGHGGGGQSMKVYLAARFERRDELRGYRDALQKEGIEVTSRWLDCSPRPDTASSEFELFLKEWGIKDEEDVRRSDALVLFTHGEGGRGGMNVEYGLAVGLGKRVLLVGPWVNAFHLLPTTTRCASFEEAKRRLTSFPANPASPEKCERCGQNLQCSERDNSGGEDSFAWSPHAPWVDCGGTGRPKGV